MFVSRICHTWPLKKKNSRILYPFIFFSVLLIVIIPAGCKKSELFQLAGTVERKTLELSAPISEIIVEIPVKEGERIDADMVVVQLDTEVAEAEMRAQESALAAAEALQSEAEGEFKRQEQLQRSRVASVKSLDAARRMRDEAVALVNEKKARVLQAQKHFNDLTITTRDSGVIDQLPFEVGERVPAGGVVAVIISDEKPWVRIWLPARAVSRMALGAEAEVKVEGLKNRLKGKVDYISREPEFTPHFALTERESAHLVYETRVVLSDAPPDIRPGIPAQVYISVSK
jgi:HlyD family secretion protein